MRIYSRAHWVGAGGKRTKETQRAVSVPSRQGYIVKFMAFKKAGPGDIIIRFRITPFRNGRD
jgi:hypothetical protein